MSYRVIKTTFLKQRY